MNIFDEINKLNIKLDKLLEHVSGENHMLNFSNVKSEFENVLGFLEKAKTVIATQAATIEKQTATIAAHVESLANVSAISTEVETYVSNTIHSKVSEFESFLVSFEPKVTFTNTANVVANVGVSVLNEAVNVTANVVASDTANLTVNLGNVVEANGTVTISSNDQVHSNVELTVTPPLVSTNTAGKIIVNANNLDQIFHNMIPRVPQPTMEEIRSQAIDMQHTIAEKIHIGPLR